MATMWVTRNALSRGICQVEGSIRGVGFFYVNKALGNYVIGVDCFHTKEEAVRQAELVRNLTIRNLKGRLENSRKLSADGTEKLTKRVKRLETLSFEEVSHGN